MTPTRAANAVTITMPRLSDSMEEATVLTWLKAPGDAVSQGEPLVEIETDKATMVYEAEQGGVLGELLVGEGEVVALGAPIAGLLVEGDAAGAGLQAASMTSTPDGPSLSPSAGGRRVPATPVASRAAADLDVALEGIAGNGPHGRIVRADVLAAAGRDGTVAAAPPALAHAETPVSSNGDEHVALTATQRTIARRMVASRGEIPEFTLTAEIDMTDALALRREVNELQPGVGVSVNDLVVKAAALVLREQPALNASWAGDHVVRHARVNVGVAVATGDALVVPVVTDADRRPLSDLATVARAAAARVRARASMPEELHGGTFTVTNLGMFGVLSFDAVIDPPQVAILAVGGVVRRPAYDEQSVVVPRDLMHVSLCCDHRAVYGADAARFLQRPREMLERPVGLLMAPAANDEETRA